MQMTLKSSSTARNLTCSLRTLLKESGFLSHCSVYINQRRRRDRQTMKTLAKGMRGESPRPPGRTPSAKHPGDSDGATTAVLAPPAGSEGEESEAKQAGKLTAKGPPALAGQMLEVLLLTLGEVKGAGGGGFCPGRPWVLVCAPRLRLRVAGLGPGVRAHWAGCRTPTSFPPSRQRRWRREGIST